MRHTSQLVFVSVPGPIDFDTGGPGKPKKRQGDGTHPLSTGNCQVPESGAGFGSSVLLALASGAGL